MSQKLAAIESDALALPAPDRAILAERLIASLEVEGDEEAEELWLQEAERRYQAYQQGRTKGKLAKDVLKDAGAKLK
jgi:putative addiction module component (TIGR02574 family)